MIRRGFSLLELLVVLAIFTLIIGLGLAAVQKVRGSANKMQCLNNMKQLGLATENSVSVTGKYPPGYTSIPDHNLSVSWHWSLLPYLEQTALANMAVQDALSYPLEERPSAKVVVKQFVCPSDSVSQTPRVSIGGVWLADVNYLGNWGIAQYRDGDRWPKPEGVLFGKRAVSKSEITDGLSNTLLAGERPANKHSMYGSWLQPFLTNVNLGIEEGEPTSTQGERDSLFMGLPSCTDYLYFQNGKWDDPCAEGHFWSYHSGGANFLFCDGSARFMTYRGRAVLIPLATRAGGDTFVE